jgi:FOG: TPR repeat, SEL1 subfamily
MKHLYFFFTLALLFVGCKGQINKVETVHYFQSGDTLSFQALNNKSKYENFREIINTGNPIRYAYINDNYYGLYFLSDLIMANKYHYTDAYVHIYYHYMSPDFNKSEWNALDTVSQHRALYYLQRAAETGSNNAQEILGQLYLNGNAFPKDIKKGEYWIKQSEEKKQGLAQQRCWFWREKWHLIYTQKY